MSAHIAPLMTALLALVLLPGQHILIAAEAHGNERLEQLDEEELLGHLAKVPELLLDRVPGTSTLLWRQAEAAAASKQPYPGPRTIAAKRRDLGTLPFREEAKCQLPREKATVLAEISGHLRGHLGGMAKVKASAVEKRKMVRTALDRQPLLWKKAAAVPALMQLLQAEDEWLRVLLVDLLREIKGDAAGEALANRAVFDPSPEVREAAVEALKARPAGESRDFLLATLEHPWPVAREGAARTLVTLEDRGALPALKQRLADTPATIPFPDKDGKLVTRELVRFNHLTNCLLCHPPSLDRDDPIRGSVPRLDQPLANTLGDYYKKGPSIRADITYLRQDFSVKLPVARPAPDWPQLQRFDIMVRTRKLTAQERKRFEANKTQRLYEARKPMLFALAGLTKKPDKAEPKAKEPVYTFEHLRTWLECYRKNERDDLSNDAVRSELNKMKDLPAIRTHCRKLFKVREVTDKTMEELSDWLCVKLDAKASEVDRMKLADVLKALDKHAPKDKK